MIKPTRKTVFIFGLSIPLAGLVISLVPEMWYLSLYLPIIVMTLFLADLAMTPKRGLINSEVQPPTRLFVGQNGLINLIIRGPGQKIIKLSALLETSLPEAGRNIYEPKAVELIMDKNEVKLEIPITPIARGQLSIKAIWLKWQGPLGLVELKKRDGQNLLVDVIQNTKGLHQDAIQFFSREAIYGQKNQPFKGEGSEFDSLSDYTQGMDHRAIDWKHSARHRKLLVKEFRQERNHQIVLGFDTGRLMLEPIEGLSKLDHAIRAGLLLGWVALRSGDLLGGAGFALRFHSFIKPGRGQSFFTHFQHFTATLDYRTEETNFTLGLSELNSKLSQRALIVLFTEFTDIISAELLIESLKHIAKRHMVVFVTQHDPTILRLKESEPKNFRSMAEAVIADEFAKNRAIVLEKVARLGVHCLDVPTNHISTFLLNKYLHIKQRGLL